MGRDNTGKEEIIVKHEEGEINSNGEHFGDKRVFNSLVISGTVFPHKRTHKAIWISTDKVTENEIDQICIGKRFRRSLQDKRGAVVVSGNNQLSPRLYLLHFQKA